MAFERRPSLFKSLLKPLKSDGDRDSFSSGKKIDPDYWGEETGASSSCPDQKTINSYITKTAAIEKVFE